MITHVTYIGGPTALVEYAGLRVLLDPTFDPPGDYPDDELTKTAGPGLPASAVEPVDLVLLSHHGHADNFDAAGRELTMRSPLVLSLPEAEAELGSPVVGLDILAADDGHRFGHPVPAPGRDQRSGDPDEVLAPHRGGDEAGAGEAGVRARIGGMEGARHRDLPPLLARAVGDEERVAAAIRQRRDQRPVGIGESHRPARRHEARHDQSPPQRPGTEMDC